MSNNLTPTMQSKYEEVAEAYAETGHPVAVSAKNQTVRALVNREKLVVTSSDEKTAYVRPYETERPGLGKRLKRSTNKHRKLMVRRLKKRK